MTKKWYIAGGAIALTLAYFAAFSRPAPTEPPAVPAAPSSSAAAPSTAHNTPAHTSSARPSPQSPVAPQAPSANAPRQTEIAKTVSKEYPYRALFISNDPMAQNTWAYATTSTYQTWDQTTGGTAAPIIVADIDTGFALDHEDLVTQWYQNPGENGMTQSGDACWTGTPADKRANDCDDDKNGYKDDWRGWNFAGTAAGNYVNPNNNPQAGVSSPTGIAVSHGTETAGLIGAASNNAKGIASINWNVRVMPLQALDDDGAGWTSDIIAAIYYAVDNDAKVINLSLGGDLYDAALEKAVTYAYEQGVIVVAAAGNCGTGTETGCDPAKPGAMSYPALNAHVIGVGATNANNTRASFSSFGPGLDVVAPGSGSIPAPRWTSTNPTSAYTNYLFGTSFASPIVASYVSLLRAQLPTASVDTITSLIDGTARKVSPMGGQIFHTEYGHGILDTLNALTTSKNLTAATAPTLLQTGSYISEHTFRLDSNLSSGCISAVQSACTIWATNLNGFDRYLPYQIGNAEGQTAGWNWPGSTLGSGEWHVRAINGYLANGSYLLLNKS